MGQVTSYLNMKEYMAKLEKIPAKGAWQYGITSALVGGIYEGELTVEELLTWGNFGLGSPNCANGGLTIVDGKVWHTQLDKGTAEAAPSQKIEYAVVLDFSPDFTFELEGTFDKNDLEQEIGARLSNRNGMYAFRVTGVFEKIATRLYPPFPEGTHTPLCDMAACEHKFEYAQTAATLVGLWMPAWVKGLNTPGYHFHFVSDDHTCGGHVFSLIGHKMKIEVCMIDGLCVRVQDSDDFRNFNFEKGSSEN